MTPHTRSILTSQPEHRSTRRAIPVALAAALAAIVGLSLSGTLAASNDDAPRGCTLATLKGRYLFADAGTLAPPAFGVTQPTPAADAGFHIFNGDGTGTDTVTFRIGGAIVLEKSSSLSATRSMRTVRAAITVLGMGHRFGIFIAPDGEAIRQHRNGSSRQWRVGH